MNARLAKIQDWTKLARQANWSVSKMAEHCGISENTLRRYFRQQFGQTPNQWITDQRFKRAVELIKDGSSIKETASLLGFQHAQTFSREFKKFWGQCPTQCLTTRAAGPVRGKMAEKAT